MQTDDIHAWSKNGLAEPLRSKATFQLGTSCTKGDVLAVFPDPLGGKVL